MRFFAALHLVSANCKVGRVTMKVVCTSTCGEGESCRLYVCCLRVSLAQSMRPSC